MDIIISSGHGKLIRGASGYIDEVDEARRVVEQVADYLLQIKCGSVITFHDDISTTQDENLEAIVDFHNMHERDIDVSVHFNAYTDTKNPMGTEVLYLTDAATASRVANRIAQAGFINRGAKYRDNLYFLNYTERPAILIEVCFVDSFADADLYVKNFDAICKLIAVGITNFVIKPKVVPDNQQDIIASVFGGGSDYNVSAYDESKVLDDESFYVALPDRFEGERPMVRVVNHATGQFAIASIEDVGPQAESGTDMTGRSTNKAGIDISPALAAALGHDGLGPVDWEFV
jgi:N-acetylmuramoyl-L-alanine amidase